MDAPVPQEKLNQVLEAGRLAPAARNVQNFTITAVKNKQIREAFVEACLGQKMIGEAPVALVLWSLEDRLMHCGQSATSVNCSIALSFMMLQARAVGLGTCWLGAFDAEKIKKILNLPPAAVVVAVSPLGIPDENPAPRKRKAFTEMIDIRE